MKKVLLTALAMGVLLANAQTVINTTWSRVTGTPNPTFNWSASDTDAGNNVINAGNTLGAGSQDLNMHIVKLDDADGSVLWETEWTSQGSYNDYASDVVVGSDAVYVCGASVVSSLDVVCVILKLDLDDGELLWTYTYDTGLMNIPSSIEWVANDGIYFCGSTTSVNTSSDFMAGRLYDYDGSEAWTQTYDYSQDYDLGVRMRVNSQSVYVTGVSGSSWTDTEITTLAFNKFSGSLTGVSNIPNPSDYIDMPTDITTDIAGNVYICGKYGTGTSCDMKVIKLDDDLDMIWEAEWDGSNDEDVPNALAVDEDGNVYVTGYSINEDNKKEMVTNAFDAAGDLLWSKRKLVKPLYDETCGTDIEYRFGKLIASGTYKKDDTTYQLVYSYFKDSGFPDWIEEMDEFALNDTAFVSLRMINANAVFTSAMTDGAGGFRYLTTRADFKKRNRVPHYDENDKPIYAAHEVFIRFNPDALNYAAIDNTNLHYGKLSSFVTSTVLTAINTKLGEDAKDYTIIKLLKGLTSDMNTSIARDGVEREIPPFYAWLSLEIPEAMDPVWVCEELSELDNYIVNMSLNQCSQMQFIPNDPKYETFQAGLHFVEAINTGYFYDLNIESAWDVKSGYSLADSWKPKVGVYDSGCRTTHEDLQSLNGMTVVGGLDHVEGGGTTVFDTNDASAYGHGTSVCGEISASTNNGKGVSGVAGGDAQAPPFESLPVQLVVHRIFGGPNDFYDLYPYLGDEDTYDSLMHAYFTEIAGAQILSASSLFSSNPVTVINQSHAGNWDGLEEEWGVQDEFAQWNRTLYNQQCLNVCCRGNHDLTAKKWPCMTLGPEDQQMCIGASDTTGRKADFSQWEGDIDVLAPGITSLIHTTNHNLDSAYWYFDGTSAATPLVSGVGALVQSYINNHPDAPNQISPEDIERLMEKYADDAFDSTGITPQTVGYDDYSGWGKLNAGNLFNGISLPNYRIWHFDMHVHEEDLIPVDTLVLNWRRDIDWANFLNYNQPTYEVEVYKAQMTNYHDIMGATVLDSWGRNSVSKVVCIDSMGTNTPFIYPYPDVQIEFVDDDMATVSGYLFKFTSTGAWYPFAPDSNNIPISYTLYTQGGYTAIREEDIENVFSVYPNPNAGIFNVDYTVLQQGDCHLKVFDTRGVLVWQKRLQAQNAGVYHEVISIPDYAQGLYLITVETPTSIGTKKIFKQ